MFVNRALKGCCASKLWTSVTPLRSPTVSFSKRSSHSYKLNQPNNPLPIYDVSRRRSPTSFLQLSNFRNFSVTLSNKNVPLNNKPTKVDEEVEPRLDPPSSTEKRENPAYTYLKNHPDYQKHFFQHQNYSNQMNEDGSLTSEGESQVNPAVKAFIDLCNTQPNEFITDPKYSPVITELISQSTHLTDEELILVLFNLRRFSNRPKTKDKDYRTIWQPFDNLCVLHIQKEEWKSNLEYLFHLADLIYFAGLSTQSKFNWELIKRLYRKVDHLSKEEMVRMMFCFGAVKSLPSTMSIYNIEYNLPRFMDTLSSGEVAVICNGFVKTKTAIHNKDVLRKLLQIIGKDAETVPFHAVSSLCKAIITSKSRISGVEEDIERFLDAFVPQISRLDIQACGSLMWLGLTWRVKHEGMCKEVLKKLEGNVELILSKDLEHICNALGSFGVECDQFFEEVADHLRKRMGCMSTKEFSNFYGKSFIPILVNFCMRNMYHEDLISFGLSDEFLGCTYGRRMFTYTQEVAHLDICSGIEAANYNGPRLSDKYRGYLSKKHMLWIEDGKATVYQKITRSLLEICVDSLGGPEFCHLCNVVPPFRTIGVVYCLRESDNKPVPVPESVTSIEDFKIKYLPEPAKDVTGENRIKFHAFVLFPGSQITVNTREPMGMAVMHCRQMKLLGFEIHPIYLGHTVTNNTEMRKFVSEALGTPIPEESPME